MKRNIVCTLLILTFSYACYAQINFKLPSKVRPFLGIKNLKANGNLKNGDVKVSMTLWNHFPKTIQAAINLEGFDNFGVTDDQGRMYEYQINKEYSASRGIKINYLSIGYFEYEGKKISKQHTVNVTLPVGKGRKFSFLLQKVGRKVKSIREFHFKNAILTGKTKDDKVTSTEGIQIRWL